MEYNSVTCHVTQESQCSIVSLGMMTKECEPTKSEPLPSLSLLRCLPWCLQVRFLSSRQAFLTTSLGSFSDNTAMCGGRSQVRMCVCACFPVPFIWFKIFSPAGLQDSMQE